MHNFEKITFEAVGSISALPAFKIHRVDCPRCHYSHDVPPEYTDWRAVAETYREAYEKTFRGFWAKLGEAGEQFDAPLQEYFLADKEAMLAEIRAIIEQFAATRPTPKKENDNK